MRLVSTATGGYRAVTRFLGRRTLVRAALAVPRTVRFVGTTALSGEVSDSVPAPSLTPGFAAGVAIDEALLAMAMAPSRFPRRADYTRVGGELADAGRLYARQGWTGHPEAYHRTPPPLADEDLTRGRGWAMGLRYERISYESRFEPYPDEPGGDRWAAYEPNRRAAVTVVRHGDGPRPWVVGVHGFCMGSPFMDFVGLQVAKLHRDLGYDVALPVLPLHGPRKVTRVSGEPFLSFDLMNTVHGLTQAVWDIRRLVSWLRAQGATSVSLYGVSLGAYVVSLLAGLEDGLDAVVAGIPVVDFPRLFHAHSPVHVRMRAVEHRIMGGTAEEVFTVVSPMCTVPKVAHDRRFVYAGYGDRLAFPGQAHALWRHWGEPRIEWYAGNHVGYLWNRQIVRLLEEVFGQSSPATAPVAAASGA